MVERSVLNVGEKKRHRRETDEAYAEYQISLLWEYQGYNTILLNGQEILWKDCNFIL